MGTMHTLPPTFPLLQCPNFTGFSEVHPQTLEGPTEPLLGSSGAAGGQTLPQRPAPGQLCWVLWAPAHSLEQRAEASTSPGLTSLGCSPTKSSSFWSIFRQDQQAMPCRSLSVSRSPCQERKSLEVVSQTPREPLEGPQKGALGCFRGRQDHLRSFRP